MKTLMQLQPFPEIMKKLNPTVMKKLFQKNRKNYFNHMIQELSPTSTTTSKPLTAGDFKYYSTEDLRRLVVDFNTYPSSLVCNRNLLSYSLVSTRINQLLKKWIEHLVVVVMERLAKRDCFLGSKV
eukprot:Awhi_evm2s13543